MSNRSRTMFGGASRQTYLCTITRNRLLALAMVPDLPPYLWSSQCIAVYDVWPLIMIEVSCLEIVASVTRFR